MLTKEHAMEVFKHQIEPKLSKNERTNCWEFCGARTKGYGVISIGGRNGKTMLTHRVTYLALVDEVLDSVCVLHSCDNACCNNPKHLFLGTKSDNSFDMASKGRGSGKKKLTTKQVNEIREMFEYFSLADLAKIYEVSIGCIADIMSRKNWKIIQ